MFIIMINILNTSNAKTRDQALNIIITKMYNTPKYNPVAYRLHGSGCSCCLSENFDIICKVEHEFKFLCYEGYIKHSKDCALIRCSCNNPFIWKNINPKEKNYENFISILDTFIPIKDNTFHNDLQYFFEQKEENKLIYNYNETNENNSDDEYISKKNYKFYFI